MSNISSPKPQKPTLVKRTAVGSFDDRIWMLNIEIKRLTGFSNPDTNCIVEVEVKGQSQRTKTGVLQNKDLVYNQTFIFDLANLEIKSGIHLPQNTLLFRIIKGLSVIGHLSLKFDKYLENSEYTVVKAWPIVATEGGPAIGNIQLNWTFHPTVVDPNTPRPNLSFPIGYHQGMSRTDAEERLKNEEQGTFLLRYSENTLAYVLSYVAKGNAVMHIGHIKETPTGISVTTETGTDTYKDLHHFVDAMKKVGVIKNSIDDASYIHVDQAKQN